MPTPKKRKKINLFSRLYCRLARHFNKREDGRIMKFINRRVEKNNEKWKKHDEKVKLLGFDPCDTKCYEGGDDGVFNKDPKNLYRFM